MRQGKLKPLSDASTFADPYPDSLTTARFAVDSLNNRYLPFLELGKAVKLLQDIPDSDRREVKVEANKTFAERWIKNCYVRLIRFNPSAVEAAINEVQIEGGEYTTQSLANRVNDNLSNEEGFQLIKVDNIREELKGKVAAFLINHFYENEFELFIAFTHHKTTRGPIVNLADNDIGSFDHDYGIRKIRKLIGLALCKIFSQIEQISNTSLNEIFSKITPNEFKKNGYFLLPNDCLEHGLEKNLKRLTQVIKQPDRLQVHNLLTLSNVTNSIEYEILDTSNKPESKQTIADKLEVLKVFKMPAAERNLAIISYFRERTESLRTRIFPQFLKDNLDLRSSFYYIHYSLFSNPFIAHTYGTNGSSDLSDYVVKQAGIDFYEQHIGTTRSIDVSSQGIKFIDPYRLKILEKKFFDALEQVHSNIENSTEACKLFALVDAFLIICHPPFDGNGRTMGEFTTFLSQKCGYPATLVLDGYRSHTSPLLEKHVLADYRFKRELDLEILRGYGITTNPEDNRGRKSYHKSLEQILTDNRIDNPAAFMDSARAIALEEIVIAIEDPNKKDELFTRYQELNSFAKIWEEGLNNSFDTVSTENQDKVDEIVCQTTHEFSVVAAMELWNEFIKMRNEAAVTNITDLYFTPTTVLALEKLMGLYEPMSDQAKEMAKLILEINPKHIGAIRILKSDELTNDENTILYLEELLEIQPNNPINLIELADVKCYIGKDPIPEYKLAFKHNPYNQNVSLAIGEYFLAEGKLAAAEGFARRAIRLLSSERAYELLYKCICQNGDISQAREIYEFGSKKFPDSYFNSKKALDLLQSTEEKSLERAKDRSFDTLLAHVPDELKVVIHSNLQEYSPCKTEDERKKTISVFDYFLEIENQSPLTNPYVLNALGVACLRLEMFDEALKHLQLALELNPRDSKILTNLGYVHQFRGEEFSNEIAEGFFWQATRANPNDPYSFVALIKNLENSIWLDELKSLYDHTYKLFRDNTLFESYHSRFIELEILFEFNGPDIEQTPIFI